MARQLKETLTIAWVVTLLAKQTVERPQPADSLEIV